MCGATLSAALAVAVVSGLASPSHCSGRVSLLRPTPSLSLSLDYPQRLSLVPDLASALSPSPALLIR